MMTGLVIGLVLLDIGVRAYMYWGRPAIYGGWGHPDDAPKSIYQARLNRMHATMDVMVRVGDAYAAGGIPAVNAEFPHWNPPGGFTPLVGSIELFPHEHWDSLRSWMRYTMMTYTRIDPLNVTVAKDVELVGSEGHNWPFSRGLTVSHNLFWNDRIELSINALVHEAMHDFWLHGLPGEPFWLLDNSSTKPWGALMYTLGRYVDSNGHSLEEYVEEQAVYGPSPF